jgi:hypothetical protein
MGNGVWSTGLQDPMENLRKATYVEAMRGTRLSEVAIDAIDSLNHEIDHQFAEVSPKTETRNPNPER